MTLRHPPRAALFDVEGTLVDSAGLILESWCETLLHAGHRFTCHDLQPYSGMDGEWMLEQLLPEVSGAERKALLDAQGERYRAQFIREARPFPGVRELFQSLSAAGVILGLATTCKADELAIYEQRLGILDLTQAVECGDTVKHGKPDPALFKKCLRALQIFQPAEASVVGDTPYDAEAAKSAGMLAVGVLSGGFSELCLREAGCEDVVESVQDVRRLWLPGRARTQ